MSAKWRALQHRHKWTYGSVVFFQAYMENLQSLAPELSGLSFFVKLKEFSTMNSVYSQVNSITKLALSFGELVSNGRDAVSSAIPFYLEILFLENSLPLHRALISVLTKGHSVEAHSELIGSCFRLLCEDYAFNGAKARRFASARVALSIISAPKLGFLKETVENSSVLIAMDICFGLHSTLMEIHDGARPSPITMERCQEAMSCLYYLLQRYPTKFSASDIEFGGQNDYKKYIGANWGVFKDMGVLGIVVKSIVDVLKSSAFSRDCLVAAGVSFCAALQVSFEHHELAMCILYGVFLQKGLKFTMGNDIKEQYMHKFNHLVLDDSDYCRKFYNGDLNSEVKSFSTLSRICLLRGILTAIPREVLNMPFTVSSESAESSNLVSIEACNGYNVSHISSSIWTILFDGILPELCDCCENPLDSHFNFHSLTVTQIALQQIKASLLANIVCLRKENYIPFSEALANRIMKIIWNNLEDPLNQTVKQVHLIFDLLLDIQSLVPEHTNKGDGGSQLAQQENGKKKSYLLSIASELLRLGGRCKGRYIPLASLAKRLGAKTLLGMRERLLFETVQAYSDDDVCCSATSFLKCFLECLRDECWNSDGVEKGYSSFRRLCLPPIMSGLISGHSKLRSNLNTYALSVVLAVDVDGIFDMLTVITGNQCDEESVPDSAFGDIQMSLTVDQRVASLVSLLKVSRSLALVEGDIDWLEKTEQYCLNSNCLAIVYLKGVVVKIPVEWLKLALTHVDDSLRIDAAELLFLNPKTSSLPSSLELSLLRKAIPLNMRCCSTAFQMKWRSLFRKFFSRVRTALDRQVKQGSQESMFQGPLNSCFSSFDDDTKRGLELFHFMKWLSCFLFFSCYPSAPYERKTISMELILTMISVWPINPTMILDEGQSGSSVPPYDEVITSPYVTLLLLGCIVDSWDKLRESSFRILLNYPTPLPGLSNGDAVKEIIVWAKGLVCSPRVRESDAGALILRLLFRKYVLEHGWIIRLSSNVVYEHPQLGGVQVQMSENLQTHRFRSPVSDYVLSLVEWLRAAAEKGEKDLKEACEKSFVHGILLTLRYTFEELDWNSEVVMESRLQLKGALEKLLEVVMRITSLALWVVSADAWFMPEESGDIVEDGGFLPDVTVEIDISENDLKALDNVIPEEQPVEQVVMVGCWLAMKEVSLLLGTITRKIPLPTDVSSSSSSSDLCNAGSANGSEEDLCMQQQAIVFDGMLELKQLEAIGDHFLQVLLKMKHNGAIDKTRAGFTALCNRLLCSNDSRLCRMTESWMEKLMERIVAKGQTVDDLLRRSAGIPSAFIALFLSEPEGTPKKLLPRALRWLIDVAKSSLLILSAPSGTHNNKCGDISSSEDTTMKNKPLSSSLLTSDTPISSGVSKVRDEGVIPTVHAFNALRAAFNDTNLATDTSGFCAEALIISIRSFSSPYWEIRNSACLAYTALVRRMIGFLNVHKRESARRALTGLEFFHRYPSLHPFLYEELKVATEMLGDGNSQKSESSIAKIVHPSLCPILILLSRLKPSTISSESAHSLDPFLFLPFVRLCATQSSLKVRLLASKALTGLVSNEKLHATLQSIAYELPCMDVLGSTSTGSDGNINNGALEGKPRFCSFNSIHGMLLQLSSLVNINCRNLADISKKEQIISQMMPVLMTCSWIGSTKLCPCPTLNGSYLQVLDHLLSVAKDSSTSKYVLVIQSLLLELTSECLELGAPVASDLFDPTKVELRRISTLIYFSCMIGGDLDMYKDGSHSQANSEVASSNSSRLPEIESSVKLDDKIISCIRDACYEVRLATLKVIHKFVNLIESHGPGFTMGGHYFDCMYGWARFNLQPILMRLLDMEDNPKCIYYVLRILFSWNSIQSQNREDLLFKERMDVSKMDRDSVLRFWEKLISLRKDVRHSKTKETLLCCMGICVKQLTKFFRRNEQMAAFTKEYSLERLHDIYSCIYSFVLEIRHCASSSEPVTMRKAAAEAMVASGLLEEATFVGTLVSNERVFCFDEEERRGSISCNWLETINRYAIDILDLWFTCIKLLEDEDVGLRCKLSIAMQRCINTMGFTKIYENGDVPVQVERVLESTFECQSSVFGNWLGYLNYLSGQVFNAGNYVTNKWDLIRRVFDKEIDNHHEERLLVCQISCFHIQKLLSRKNIHEIWGKDIKSMVEKWRMKYLGQILSFSENYINSDDSIVWIAGIANHQDAFISLYANLLGLYAFSHCPGDENHPPFEIVSGVPLYPGLVGLGGIMTPLLRNPLISNLYFLVLKVYEKLSGVKLCSSEQNKNRDLSCCQGFDPYFLLR
ncbi:hypothetical protein AMTRI_Chr04g189990 [Amborella trichopoda]